MFKDYIEKIISGEMDLKKFSKGYEKFGIHVNADNSVTAKEWAPGAQQLYLTGDFSNKLLKIILTFIMLLVVFTKSHAMYFCFILHL